MQKKKSSSKRTGSPKIVFPNMSPKDMKSLLDAMSALGRLGIASNLHNGTILSGKKGLQLTYQFKIQIRGIKKPPVWRRVTIPANFTFAGVHAVIQSAFGWWNEHLYMFGDTPYSRSLCISEPHESDWEAPTHNALTTTVGEYFGDGNGPQKLCYVYDFGDDWTHDIKLEKVIPELHPHASCLAGKGACPEEDSGGVWGYEEMKETDEVDPHDFDLEEADETVKQIAPEGLGRMF